MKVIFIWKLRIEDVCGRFSNGKLGPCQKACMGPRRFHQGLWGTPKGVSLGAGELSKSASPFFFKLAIMIVCPGAVLDHGVYHEGSRQ